MTIMMAMILVDSFAAPSEPPSRLPLVIMMARKCDLELNEPPVGFSRCFHPAASDRQSIIIIILVLDKSFSEQQVGGNSYRAFRVRTSACWGIFGAEVRGGEGKRGAASARSGEFEQLPTWRDFFGSRVIFRL